MLPMNDVTVGDRFRCSLSNKGCILEVVEKNWLNRMIRVQKINPETGVPYGVSFWVSNLNRLFSIENQIQE